MTPIQFYIVKPVPAVETYIVELWIEGMPSRINWSFTTIAQARAMMPTVCKDVKIHENPNGSTIEVWS